MGSLVKPDSSFFLFRVWISAASSISSTACPKTFCRPASSLRIGLAEALDCDPRTIVKAAKAGKIPTFRVDKEVSF
jgi:hypothetical protein